MKKGILAALGAALVIILAATAGVGVGLFLRDAEGPPRGGSVAAYAEVAPQAAPDIPILDGGGQAVRLADFAGETLVVNFWATWCAPCVEEMPSLDRLARVREGQGVRVLAIAVGDDTPEGIAAFYERVGVRHLAIYRDPTSRSLAAFGAYGLPTTVVIAPDGTWRGTLVGAADWDSREALALVDHYREPAP